MRIIVPNFHFDNGIQIRELDIIAIFAGNQFYPFLAVDLARLAAVDVVAYPYYAVDPKRFETVWVAEKTEGKTGD